MTLTGLWYGLIWAILKLSRRDEWGSNKKWLILIESEKNKFKTEESRNENDYSERTYSEPNRNINFNESNYISVLGLSEDFEELS